MSFWSHLDELRKRIVYISIAIGVGFIACFNYSEDILGLLLLPLNATAGFQGSFPLYYVHAEQDSSRNCILPRSPSPSWPT